MKARPGPLMVLAAILAVSCSQGPDATVTADRVSSSPAAPPQGATATTVAPPTIPVTTTFPTDPTPTMTTPSATTAPPACRESDFRAALAFSQPSYRVGETVGATGSFTKVSGGPCVFSSTQSTITVVDVSGAEKGRTPVLVGDYFAAVTVTPGETRHESVSWDSKGAASGTYTAAVTVKPFGTADGAFVLS